MRGEKGKRGGVEEGGEKGGIERERKGGMKWNVEGT